MRIFLTFAAIKKIWGLISSTISLRQAMACKYHMTNNCFLLKKCLHFAKKQMHLFHFYITGKYSFFFTRSLKPKLCQEHAISINFFRFLDRRLEQKVHQRMKTHLKNLFIYINHRPILLPVNSFDVWYV